MIVRHIRISNDVAEKIRKKHSIKYTEVEEAFEGKIEVIRVGGNQYKLIGRTKSGRCLAVFFRYAKATAEITTARDVDKKEKRRC